MLHKKTIFFIFTLISVIIIIIYFLFLIFSSKNTNALTFVLESTSINNDINSLINNNLRTTIKISDKNQKVDIFLLSHDSTFFITEKNIFYKSNKEAHKYANNFYNNEISTSLTITTENKIQLSFGQFNYFRRAKENFEIDKYNLNQFNFMLADDPLDKISGGIGLGFNYFQREGEINLFNELYLEKYIISPVWYIDYDNLEHKKLIVGDYPYNINNKYNKDDYSFTTIDKNSYYWEMEMKQIKIGSIEEFDKVIKDKKVNFVQECAGIYGPPQYYNKIKQIFFQKYFSNNQCYESTLSYQSNNYKYITCNNDINIKDFPSLEFDITYDIKAELTYEDLFVSHMNKKLFLFFTHEKYFRGIWYLGEPFLKKYKPIFVQNEYQIGFYKAIKKKESRYIVAKAFGVITFCIILCIVIYLCFYIYRKHRNRIIKKAAKEMKLEEISRKLILSQNNNYK